MKKYKYITININENAKVNKKPTFIIENNKSNDPLGYLVYCPQWRQFIFAPIRAYDVVFNKSCLLDIIDFIDNEIPKHL